MIPEYRIDGPAHAPALLLSNSLGTDLSMWDAQISTLCADFRVVRYDQRGHGATPATPGPYTLAELGADVVELLDHLGLDRVHYAGVSLGGMIGMWLGENAPERLDRLALICTAAQLPPDGWLDRAALVRRDGTAALRESLLGRWFTPRCAGRADITARFGGMIDGCVDEGYASCCEAIAGMDIARSLSEITANTLVIAGRDDPATPPEHAERIAEAIPARLAVLDDAAHLANVEQADQVTALLIDHFRGEPT